MYLGVSFSVLLASVLVALSAVEVQAAPAKRGAGMVTLPIQRVTQKRDGVHPHIYMQQHMNRGYKRLARMTGRAAPSNEELRANIEKRMALIGGETLGKRYNRKGNKALAEVQDLKANAKVGNTLKGGKGVAVGGGAAAAAAAEQAASSGAGAASAINATGSVTANDGSTSGVSPIDLKAQSDVVLTQANAPTTSNSLGLAIEGDDTGYVAQIQLGTPPKNFNILMDSGSADFWVGNAENCVSTAGGGCGTHNFLGTSTSSSFQQTTQQFEVTYGTGAVAGTLCQDNVGIAGLNLKAHTFGTANQETDDFADDSVLFDGLMGLAQSGLSQQKVPTPVESLASAGLINDAITSFKISRLRDQKNDGEVTFGGLDQSKFDANTLTTFDNVNTQGFWEGAVDSFTVDGQDSGLEGRTAILDTGTTLIQAPQNDATAIHQLISGAQDLGQGMFSIPCTTNASLALTFNKQSFAIEPQDLAFAPLNANDPTGDCMSAISGGAAAGGSDTEWLVGDTFLKNAYFSTDIGKNQISLANLV